VWLTASVPTITRRIGGDTQRPSLTGVKSFVEEIREVSQQRRPIYQAAAHHVVSTDERSIEQIVDDILGKCILAT
jgi:shikimate kinase